MTCSHKQKVMLVRTHRHTHTHKEAAVKSNGPLQMKYVVPKTLRSTFTECTGKQAQFETQCIDMLLLCPAIPVKFPPFQIKKNAAYLPAGSFSDYLTALGLAWQPAKGGRGRRGDARRRRRVELARDEVLRSVCVHMHV